MVKRCVSMMATMSLVLCACGGSDGPAGQAGSGSTALLAPELKGIMVMNGLHLTWANRTTDCDSNEGERKTDGTDFAPLFSTPGSVATYLDGTADQGMTYTYRIRCKRGSEYSGYSNELSGNPKP